MGLNSALRSGFCHLPFETAALPGPNCHDIFILIVSFRKNDDLQAIVYSLRTPAGVVFRELMRRQFFKILKSQIHRPAGLLILPLSG